MIITYIRSFVIDENVYIQANEEICAERPYQALLKQALLQNHPEKE